jgi:hypothetical protein
MPDCFRSLCSALHSAPAVFSVFLGILSTSTGAQAFVEIRAGAQGSSVLVRDSISQGISVKPQVAPSIVLAGGSALNDRWILALSLRWAKSDLMRQESDQEARILPLGVWTGMLAVRRTVTNWASVEGSIGGIKYAPGGDLNGTVFQEDSPLVPAIGAAARIEWGIGSRWGAGLEVAYDFHRFTTQALQTAGFRGARPAHRVGLSVVFQGNLTSASR